VLGAFFIPRYMFSKSDKSTIKDKADQNNLTLNAPFIILQYVNKPTYSIHLAESFLRS
jgi:hypothetical protein